ncbi:MAG: glycoside hydrolase family 99-like domain-containing protein [Actinomycetota bacterium]|nr:glycoside hydrolase family 99-like domain-containing protein [Actinomycetota bacterium]
MSGTERAGHGGDGSRGEAADPSGEPAPRVLAFYLPQFHAVPENDAWYGRGFTEWTVVARAAPLFAGHRQPHLPGELGFYDLRVPETRERQARLARDHGVSGFLYYHYWFAGTRMLDRPFAEVLGSGRPNFPFALCWANDSWYRKWQGRTSDEMLVEQTYSEEDDRDHIRWLIEAFRDPRYIRVHGRPLLAVYRPHLLPAPKRTFDLWREECSRAGVPDPWLVRFDTAADLGDPADQGFDASADFVPHGIDRVAAPAARPPDLDPSNFIFDYDTVAAAYRSRDEPPWVHYPCVVTDWDNTPRRPTGDALILHGSTPDGYGAWLGHALRRQSARHGGDGIVFVNAWNEWAEGAHLEPDQTHGRAYLDRTLAAVRAVGGSTPERTGPDALTVSQSAGSAPTAIWDLYDDLYDRFVRLQALASGLVAHADRQLAAQRRELEAALAQARQEAVALAAENALLLDRLAQASTRAQGRAAP